MHPLLQQLHTLPLLSPRAPESLLRWLQPLVQLLPVQCWVTESRTCSSEEATTPPRPLRPRHPLLPCSRPKPLAFRARSKPRTLPSAWRRRISLLANGISTSSRLAKLPPPLTKLP